MATEAGQQPEAGSAWTDFLSRIVVAIICGVWARLKDDPQFADRLRAGFAALDQAKTPEENDAAALDIQSQINS